MQHRKKFGLILPSSNTTMEWEFQRLLPSFVSLHTSRVRLSNVNVESLQLMEEELDRAAKEVADAAVDLICYGCTSGSLIQGSRHEEGITKRMHEITGIPSLTTAGAVCDALHDFNVRCLGVVTPYIEQVNEREQAFFEDREFEVVSLSGLGLSDNIEIGAQNPETVYNLVMQISHAEADAVFISCTNLRTIEIIEKLEHVLDKPVISSNTATLWKMLRIARVRAGLAGYGRLLSTLS